MRYKFIITFLAVTTIMSSPYAQYDGHLFDNHNCINDSLNFHNIRMELDTNSISFIYRDGLRDKFIKSDYCAFMHYVSIFNTMLELGLDLKFDYANNPPERLSIIMADGNVNLEVEKMKKKNDDLQSKHTLFRNFLKINDLYKRNIINTYTKRKTKKQFYAFIDNVIAYGTYSQPRTLKAILKYEYPHLTRENLDEQIRERVLKELKETGEIPD